MVIDASVWLSAAFSTDVNHPPTAQWLRMMNRTASRVSVPAHFPAEVIGVVRRIGPAARSVDFTIDSLFESEFVDIHVVSLDLARLSAEVAGQAALRGSDAIYVALAAMLEVPLITWDRQQRARGRLVCRAMTPIEALELAN